jgi:hypothetical protein
MAHVTCSDHMSELVAVLTGSAGAVFSCSIAAALSNTFLTNARSDNFFFVKLLCVSCAVPEVTASRAAWQATISVACFHLRF